MRKHVFALAAGVLVLAFQVAGGGGDADHAKDLVAKAIKASGGVAKVARLQAGTCKVKATVQEAGQQINATLDVTWQGWDQYRLALALDINGMAKNGLIVINGAKGWGKDSDRNETKEAPAGAVPMITGVLYALR